MANINILILVGRFGMGHYCAAEAIKQEIERVNPSAAVTTVDFMEYMFPASNRAIYRGFDFMVNKFATVYNLLNIITGKIGDVPLKNTVSKRVGCLLSEYSPDIVISTLPVSSQYISAYKERTGLSVPLYTYITDIEVHTDWIADQTDLYFVGSENTKADLISKGVERNKIIISGIPVRGEFKNIHNKSLKTGGSKTEILIMGGGLGMLPCSDRLLSGLCKEESVHVTVICGKNKKLFYKLNSEFPGIDVVGYTDRVADYMKKSDLLITKSGGVTTFEAIYADTPLYIIKPFLQQEIGNAEFIENKQIGRVMWANKKDIEEDILSLVNNKEAIARMKENMISIKESFAPLCPTELFCEDDIA